MSKHQDPYTLYSEYICYVNFIDTCKIYGIVDEEKGEKSKLQAKKNLLKIISENKYIEYEYGYMGGAL